MHGREQAPCSSLLVGQQFATGLTPNYAGGWDYNIGATYNVTKALSVGVQYIGVDGVSLRDYSNDTAVFTIKYTF